MKMEWKTEDISFVSDNLKLIGTLHKPAGNRHPIVIGCHGLLSDANSPKQIDLAHACNRVGIAYFRFDHRGCGRSQGNFRDVTSLEGRSNDLKAAVEALKNRDDLDKNIGIFGSSMGGAVCLSAAGHVKPVAIVINAAPIRSRGVMIQPSDTSSCAYDPHRLHFELGDSISGIQDILIFHGDADDVVPPAHASQVYELVREPKRLIIFKGGDHLISNPVHQKQFIKETCQWFETRLKRH